jgi:hypothetical protein
MLKIASGPVLSEFTAAFGVVRFPRGAFGRTILFGITDAAHMIETAGGTRVVFGLDEKVNGGSSNFLW